MRSPRMFGLVMPTSASDHPNGDRGADGSRLPQHSIAGGPARKPTHSPYFKQNSGTKMC